jgi:hypothetical protein
LAVLGVGCTKADMYAYRSHPTDLAPDEGVTVVLEQFSGEFSGSKEDKFIGCITSAIRKVHPTVRIVPSDEFRQAAFPDLPPEEVGHRSWEQLADDPALRQRIAPLGLHYLIALSGGTTQNMKSFIAVSGMYGAPMYGVDVGDKKSSLHATIIDLKQGSRVGHVAAFAQSQSRSGWLFLPPFYMPSAPTETRVCRELGKGVAKFLAGEKLPEEMGIWPAMAEDSPEEMETEQFEEAPAWTEEGATSTGKAEN